MGTGCYLIVERRNEDDSWSVVPPYDAEPDDLTWRVIRNYDVFGVLGCDWRSDTPAAFPPRGLPADAAAETRAYFIEDDPDAHPRLYVLSWWTTRELLAQEWPPDSDHWRKFIAQLATMGDADRVRIVFGFD